MPSDFPALTDTGFALIATYLVHSTVWLAAAWIFATTRGRRSATLRERIWRWAALLPFVTTAGQFLGSERPQVWTWTIPAMVSSESNMQPASFPNIGSSFPNSGLGTHLPEAPLRDPSAGVDPSRSGREAEFLERAFPSRSLGTREPRPLASPPIAAAPLAPAAVIVQPSPPSIAPLAPEHAGRRDVTVEPTPIDETAADGSGRAGELAPGFATAPAKDPDTTGSQAPRSDVTRRLSDSWGHLDNPALSSRPISTSLPSLPSVSEHEATKVTKDGTSRQTDSHPPSGRLRTEQPFSPSIARSADPTASTQTGPHGRWVVRVFVAAVGLWIIVGLLRVCWSAARTVVRIRRHSVLTDGPACDLLWDLCESRGVRRDVRLVTCEWSAGPAALGLWRWTILLPAGIETQLDRPQLRALLAHELAHLVRGDVRWLWIGRTLTAAFGWQPLHRLAVRRWREASEQLCDDWAVAGGVSRLTLAKCLTRIAELRLSAAEPAPGLTVIGRRTRLIARIERLTSPPPPDPWNTRTRRRFLTAALLSAAAALTYTGPHIVWAVPSDEPTTSEPNSPSFPSSGLGTPLPEAPLRDPSPGVGPSNGGRETEFLESAFPSRSLGTRPSESLGTRTSVGDDSLTKEIDALRHDLERALQLLAETDSDPEITALVDRIRQRVDALETHKSETVP